jgi:hypothetical protein
MHECGRELFTRYLFNLLFLVKMKHFLEFSMTGSVDARKAAHDKVLNVACLIGNKADFS